MLAYRCAKQYLLRLEGIYLLRPLLIVSRLISFTFFVFYKWRVMIFTNSLASIEIVLCTAEMNADDIVHKDTMKINWVGTLDDDVV